jgi:hypothetical protein
LSRPAVVAVAAVIAASLTLAAASEISAADRPAPAPPSCVLADGVLTIDPKLWTVTIRRDGDEVVPSYGRRVSCAGGTPTIHNVDLVHLLDDEIRLNLRNGHFAPGATDEGDGSSEIEFEIEHGIGGALEVIFGDGPDRVQAANLGPERDGYNLNADEGVPDVDIELVPQEPGFGRAVVALELAGGPDVLGAGISDLPGPRNRLTVLGGPGADVLTTGDGRDTAVGEDGRDRLMTAGGVDFVAAKDGGRDRIDCGAGLDLVEGDRHDRLRRCQRFGSATDAQLEQFING